MLQATLSTKYAPEPFKGQGQVEINLQFCPRDGLAGHHKMGGIDHRHEAGHGLAMQNLVYILPDDIRHDTVDE
jgi:hypothetical protein